MTLQLYSHLMFPKWDIVMWNRVMFCVFDKVYYIKITFLAHLSIRRTIHCTQTFSRNFISFRTNFHHIPFFIHSKGWIFYIYLETSHRIRMCLFVVIASSARCVSKTIWHKLVFYYYCYCNWILYANSINYVYVCCVCTTRSRDNKVGYILKTCSVAVFIVPIKAKHPHWKHISHKTLYKRIL